MFLTPIQFACVWQQSSPRGTGGGRARGCHWEPINLPGGGTEAGSWGGEGTAFDGQLACMLQNACEAKPPLPRRSAWDKINVSPIVLIAANKCLNNLMESREFMQGPGGQQAALEEVCGLITG